MNDKIIAALAAASLAATAWATETTNSSDIVISAEGLTIDVASGDTVVYSGKLSGEGGITKTGLGTLRLSGDNTYTGGFTLNGGKVWLDSATALGRSIVTISAPKPSKTSECVQFFFNAPDAVITNDFRFEGVGSTYSEDYAPFVFCASTTFTGDITTADARALRMIGYSGLSDAERAATVVHLYGDIKRDDGTAWIVKDRVYGNHYFHRGVKFDGLIAGIVYSGAGSIHLCSPENTFNYITIRRATVVCEAKNVLNGAYVTLSDEQTGWLDLNGYDQTIRYLSSSRNTDLTSSQQVLTSDTPAVLTINSDVSSMVSSSFLVTGKVGICLDITKDVIQNFCVRKSTTTGTIHVKSGVFGTSSGATFSNVPAMRIEADGEFRIRDVGNATKVLASVTNLYVDGIFSSTAFWRPNDVFTSTMESLVIGENATVKMTSGDSIKTKYLKIGSKEFTHGTFTGSDFSQLQGVTIYVVGKGNPVTWAGAGADTNVGSAGNWQEAEVDLTHGSRKAVFASAGAEARINTDVYFSGLLFDLPGTSSGFDLTDGSGKITLGSDGLTASPVSDKRAMTYNVGPAVSLVESQKWSVPSNQTLRLAKGFSTQSGTWTELGGGGRYEWTGTNTIAGGMLVTGSVLKVTGMIASPNHSWEGEASSSNAQRIELLQSSEQGYYTYMKGGMTNSAVLVMDNAKVEKPLLFGNVMGTHIIRTLPGTTNEISGHIQRLRYNARGVEDGWGSLYLHPDSLLTISGGYNDIYAATRVQGGGTLRIANRPVKMRNSVALNADNGGIVFDVANNNLTYLTLGFYDDGYRNWTEFRVSDALTNGIFICGTKYVNGSRFVSSNESYSEAEFHSTTQRVERVSVFPRATLRGDYPSKLVVFGDLSTTASYLYAKYTYIAGKIEGGLGIDMCGKGTLLMTNQQFESCGDLKVTSGTLEFASSASWRNGKSVTIGGTGTFKTNASKTLSSGATVTIEDNGILSIADGCVERVAALTVEGESVESGWYTYATAPAKLKAHLADTTGLIRVSTPHSLMMLIR